MISHVIQGLTTLLLLILTIGVWKVMSALDDITASVGTLETAATTSINKINELKATGTDPTALATLTGRINTVANSLTAASQ